MRLVILGLRGALSTSSAAVPAHTTGWTQWVKTLVYLAGVRERAQEQCVRETCEASLLLSLHPRSSLTLVLQVLHDDGSVSFNKVSCYFMSSFPVLQLRATVMVSNCVSLWVFLLTSCPALVLLSECSLHGSDGCRAAYELPVLRCDLCHRHWRSDHHRPHCGSREGKSDTKTLSSINTKYT